MTAPEAAIDGPTGAETLDLGYRTRPRRAPLVRALLAALLVALALAYLAAVERTADRLPRNARVGGVAVGGLSRGAAEQKLRAELGPALAQPFSVWIDTDIEKVYVPETGLGVDFARSVQLPTRGGRFDPRQVWEVLRGGSATGLVLTVKDVQLATCVARLARAADHGPHNATAEYEGPGSVGVSEDEDGLSVDRAGAARVLQAAYPRTHRGTVTFPVRRTPAAVRTTAAEEAIERYAWPAVSAGVVVDVTGGGRLRISARTIGKALTFVPRGHALVPHLDGGTLLAGARGHARLGVAGRDLAAAVEPALTRTGRGRTVTVRGITVLESH